MNTEKSEVEETKARGELIAMDKCVIVSKVDDNVYVPVVNDAEGSSARSLIKNQEKVGNYEYKGRVLAVGTNMPGVEVGDLVHHGIHSGIIWVFNGENLLTIREPEICAIEKQQ